MVPSKPSSKVYSGSPRGGEPEYLLVGTLRRPHGVHGAIIMQVITDFPDRLRPQTQLFLGDSHTPVSLLSARPHNQGLVIKLLGVETPEEAGNLRNQSLYARAADRPRLPSGQFYHHQLIGLPVVDEGERAIGTLSDVLQTGANDVFVVKRANGSEVLLPVIPAVVLSMDVDRRLIRVRVIPGLFEGSESADRDS